MSSIKLRNDHQPKFQSFSYSIFGSTYFWLLQKCTCAFTFSLPLAGKLTLPLNCLSRVFANIHCLFPYQLCTCAQVHFLSTCSKFLLLHPARLSCSLASLAAQPFQRQLAAHCMALHGTEGLNLGHQRPPPSLSPLCNAMRARLDSAIEEFILHCTDAALPPSLHRNARRCSLAMQCNALGPLYWPAAVLCHANKIPRSGATEEGPGQPVQG